MHQIFLVIDGQQQGPFPIEQVRQAVKRGEYPAETLAWYEGLAEWMPLTRILGAANAPAASLPAAVTASPAGVPVAAPGVATLTKEELRDIARRQNLLMWSLVAGIASYVLAKIAFIGFPALLAATIFEVYALYTLCRSLRVRAAWVYCILLFVPIVSLITLVIFSGKATKILKAHGVRVGFMGGKAEDIQ